MILANLPTVTYVAIDERRDAHGPMYFEAVLTSDVAVLNNLSAEKGEWKFLEMQALTRRRK